MFLNLVVLLFITIPGALACRGQPNPYPSIDANFKLVNAHKFGEKYHFYSPQLNQNYYILKVWGTPYQAGLAQGSLLRQEMSNLIKDLWTYYHSIAEQQFKFITKLPESLQPLGRTLAIKLYRNLLYANHLITKRFTPKHFAEQYSGISQASGIPLRQLVELNMLPEYTRAGCSILGAWGKSTYNGDLIHLRALDWDVHNPINKYPVFTFYNITIKGSRPFVNLGWAGFVGSLTGFGQDIGVGQKVRKQNPVKQNQTRYGKPWTYAIRDVIQFTQTIDQALDNLHDTRRTCSIYLGVSSIKNMTFRLIEYSYKQFKVYDDQNFTYNAAHSQMDDVVVMAIHEDKGDACFNDLLKNKYGNITGEWITNTLAASHHTGDTQLATFNFHTKELYFQVSNSSKLAFQRPAIRVQLAPYFRF